MPSPPPLPDPAAIPVACALIERDGTVLIAQRPAHKHLGGQWEFPGGKIEPGESPAAALRREIEEELRCRIEVGPALPPSPHSYPTTTIVLHPFICHLAPGSPEPTPVEHTALRWLSPAELATTSLAAADRPIVHHYLAHLQ